MAVGISIEQAKKLKEAGFPQEGSDERYFHWLQMKEGKTEKTYLPDLSELIEACGDEFHELHWCAIGRWDTPRRWSVWGHNRDLGPFVGTTPEEAVANLYLSLNQK